MARSREGGGCQSPVVVRLAAVRAVDLCDEHTWHVLASSEAPLRLEARYRDDAPVPAVWERLWHEADDNVVRALGVLEQTTASGTPEAARGLAHEALRRAVDYRSGLAGARARWRVLQVGRDEGAEPPGRR